MFCGRGWHYMSMVLSTSETIKRLVLLIDEKNFMYFHEFVAHMADVSSVDYSVMVDNAIFFEMYITSRRRKLMGE